MQGPYNGVQIALANGIPLITAGKSEDKPEVCARIEWCGAGINLNTQTPKPEKIRQAVTQVLAEQSYRQNARRLRAEIEDCQPAETAVHLLAALLTEKQIVQS